jgi:KDO2-lipid IV(A) lauroyltransferase
LDFQQFATSTFGTRLWLSLGRAPLGPGHAVARLVTNVLHRRKRALVYGVIHANQSVVLGPSATPAQVDAAVGALLRHAGMAAFDLVHAVAGGEAAILRSIGLSDEFWPNIAAAQATGRGILICGGHLSNFNLGFLAFSLKGGFPMQILSAPMAGGGFRIVSDLRARGLLEETPVDASSLRKAIKRLRDGGVALIGVDWPLAALPDERITFFGRPANLPTGYARLAISGNAVLLPLGCRWLSGRGYIAMTAPHIDPPRTGDRESDALETAGRVLGVIEQWIRETPDQWLMYHRVWPEA